MSIVGIWVVNEKNRDQKIPHSPQIDNIGTFNVQKICAKSPRFLRHINIPQPVIIDLSQKKYKGIAFYHGESFSKVLHPKIWEQYEHFSTYSVDDKGNIFLVPTPFISIYPTTFNLQKNIYTLDSETGKISIFMHFESVDPSAQNPYGINAITFDCDDKTLWAATIDSSNYRLQKGRIFHISTQEKRVLAEIPTIDALSLATLKTNKEKYLLVGSARDNGLYAYNITVKNNKYKKSIQNDLLA